MGGDLLAVTNDRACLWSPGPIFCILSAELLIADKPLTREDLC